MNSKERKGNGNKKRLPPTGCKILSTTPWLLQITFWRKMKHKKWWSSDFAYWQVRRHTTYLNANTFVQKIFNTTWKEHEGKGNEWTCYETNWNDSAGNDNKLKTPIAKGLENLTYYHYPLGKTWRERTWKQLKRHEWTGQQMNWKKRKRQGQWEKTTAQKLEPVISDPLAHCSSRVWACRPRYPHFKPWSEYFSRLGVGLKVV